MTKLLGFLIHINYLFVPNIFRPITKKIADKFFGIKEIPNYQGVRTQFFLHQIHEGKFSSIHEKYCLLDSHLNYDLNITRLRNYNLCTFATLALSNTKSGDFLFCGISFGTSALVVSEFTNLKKYDRAVWFIDPMDGRGRGDYNSNPRIVQNRWNKDIPLTWLFEPIGYDIINKVSNSLSFVHINTTAWEDDLESLPGIFYKLESGGFIIFDQYGWKSRSQQLKANALLDKLGANYFVSTSLQLIIFK